MSTGTFARTTGPSPGNRSENHGGLLQAAEPLLKLAQQHGTGSAGVPEVSAREVAAGLRQFIESAVRQGYPREVVENGSNALRLLLAGSGDPADLRRFLQTLTDQLRLDRPHRDLLGLLIAVFSLGMEERLLAAGYEQREMERLRTALLQAVVRHEQEHPWRLSPQWESDYRGRPPLASKLPVWVAAALAGLLLLGAYQGFRFAARQSMEPVAVELEFIARPDMQ